jgi:hypothetical protein
MNVNINNKLENVKMKVNILGPRQKLIKNLQYVLYGPKMFLIKIQ